MLTEQEIFDFVIADLFQTMSSGTVPFMEESYVMRFAQFSRRVLVPGGYLFIFLYWSRLPEWQRVLQSNQMDTCAGPFRMCLDTDEVQINNSKQCQDPLFVALVAKKPGKHPEGFTMDITAPYLHITRCQFARKFGIIDKVPLPLPRLMMKPSRKQVRPTEKSSKLFLELLQTFCPALGKVSDPFGGAMTSAMACMMTRRPCTVLESDEQCVKYAVPRLQVFARAQNVDENSSRDTRKVTEFVQDTIPLLFTIRDLQENDGAVSDEA